MFLLGQTIDDRLLQATVDSILDLRAVRSRFGSVRVRVVKGRGGAEASRGKISLGVNARTEWVMCHELAHLLTPSSCAAHGPEFAGVYLFLIRAVFGKDAAAGLRNSFKANRVSVSMRGVPKPVKPASVPPRQYERIEEARMRLVGKLPTAEAVAARSAAGRKAWQTRRQAADGSRALQFPLRVRLYSLASEMEYQRGIAEESFGDGYPETTWHVSGSFLVVADEEALDDVLYRLETVRDIGGLGQAASLLHARLSAARPK